MLDVRRRRIGAPVGNEYGRSMRAWRVHELGEPAAVMRLEDLPDPDPGPGQLVLAVHACALNFPDVLQCRGEYQVKPPLPFTPGLEVCGTVVAAAPGLEGRVGDRVVAPPVMPNGGLATRTVVDAHEALPVPVLMTDAEAASLTVTYQTGWFALFRRAHLRPGETVLVHAGAGGVGSAAIQLAKTAGAVVFATAGGPDKVEVCRELGADVAIDYLADDFVEIVKELTDGRGVDVVYDPVGGDIFDRSRRIVAWEGRILPIGFTSGRIADAPTNHALLKNYSVVGVHWARYRDHDPDAVIECHHELCRLHEQGGIKPLIGAEFPLEDAVGALEALGSRGTVGKVVVAPEPRVRP